MIGLFGALFCSMAHIGVQIPGPRGRSEAERRISVAAVSRCGDPAACARRGVPQRDDRTIRVVVFEAERADRCRVECEAPAGAGRLFACARNAMPWSVRAAAQTMRSIAHSLGT
jgi:hypothetical protein